MIKNIVFPFFIKGTLILLGLVAFFFILFITKDIIVPLIYSGIIAIVLSPVVNYLTKKGINRTISIVLILIVLVLVVLVLVGLLSSQFVKFGDSFPTLIEDFGKLFDKSSSWVSDYFNISPRKVNSWIGVKKTELLNLSSEGIGNTIVSTGNVLVLIVLIPVYVFMILYYQPLLIEFIHKAFEANKQNKVTKILVSIKTIIQNYLIGLLLDALIVAVMNITSLLIIGIEYAVLLGIIGAVLNFIPYLGGIIAATLSIVVTLATTSSISYCLIVLASYGVVQVIENNFILPKLVASKVKINALVSIIVVLAGGALWGVAGMFLSIPLIAIVKVMFDQIDSLKPWGYLLGDTMPKSIKLKFLFKKKNAE